MVHENKTSTPFDSKSNSPLDWISVFIHEINQPLTAIMAYSHCCLLRIKNQSDSNELLLPIENIARQAIHAGDTLHAIHDLIREGDFDTEETDINALIQACMPMLGAELLDFELNLVLNLEAGLPSVRVNKLHIMRVILNLARNSMESFRDSLTVGAQLTINTGLTNGHIVICVLDNGPGIPPNMTDQILATHFTTKPQGTGIGLSVCQFLIKAHGGHLSVQDNGSRGAWFSFTLPITSPEIGFSSVF